MKTGRAAILPLHKGLASLPREDWGYSLHVINNVDGSNCKMESTKALDEQELVGLLKEIFDELT